MESYHGVEVVAGIRLLVVEPALTRKASTGSWGFKPSPAGQRWMWESQAGLLGCHVFFSPSGLKILCPRASSWRSHPADTSACAQHSAGTHRACTQRWV